MDPILSQISLYPLDFEIEGWFRCDGRRLPINEYQALYSLIREKFGGDGRTSFSLPDLRGKSPIPGLEYYIAYNGVYPSRS